MLPRLHTVLEGLKVMLPLEGRAESQGNSAARRHLPSSSELG